MGVFESYQERYDAALEEELSLQDYLDLCKSDVSVYATAAERLLLAIGEPEFVDTSKDSRLSGSFPTRSSNVIRRSMSSTEWKRPSSRSCRSSDTRLKAWKSANRFSICLARLAAVRVRWLRKLKR